MVSILYSVMRFLGVPVYYVIMLIFAPTSIHPDCLSLSANLSLNRLMDFYSPSNSSGRFRIALLKSLRPVVDVYSVRTVALACMGVRENRIISGMIGAGLNPSPPPAYVLPL